MHKNEVIILLHIWSEKFIKIKQMLMANTHTKKVRITTDDAMLVLRDAVTFRAFSAIREPTTTEIRLRVQLSLCETSLHEGKLVCELEIIYPFVHLLWAKTRKPVARVLRAYIFLPRTDSAVSATIAYEQWNWVRYISMSSELVSQVATLSLSCQWS
jgi:hypothetical protein